jgi:hypothetical protein
MRVRAGVLFLVGSMLIGSDADEAEEEGREGDGEATSPKKAAAAPAAPAAVPGCKKKVLTVAGAPAGAHHVCSCAACDGIVWVVFKQGAHCGCSSCR